ncbi:hypothetical protein JTB14_032301 [Gonioctena quinquepunctata]|nr:hypothetical protein JTB14_032301 [Gonioctena quinquepunctata]
MKIFVVMVVLAASTIPPTNSTFKRFKNCTKTSNRFSTPLKKKPHHAKKSNPERNNPPQGNTDFIPVHVTLNHPVPYGGGYHGFGRPYGYSDGSREFVGHHHEFGGQHGIVHGQQEVQFVHAQHQGVGFVHGQHQEDGFVHGQHQGLAVCRR